MLSPALPFLDRVPRSRWLSFGGDVAVTLVLLEIIPELAQNQETLSRTLAGPFTFLDRHIYLLTLTALTNCLLHHPASGERLAPSPAGSDRPGHQR